MQNKRIVITGSPGTGKSSVIKELESLGNICLHEISREITMEAQKQGIEQLFLDQPLLFSEKLMKARIEQHQQVKEISGNPVFLDRGIPDVVAYLDYAGNSYPQEFDRACQKYKYTAVYLLPPWKEIYLTDNQRYETFEQALLIHQFLKKAYITYGYSPIEVPKNTIGHRCDFILNNLGE